MQQARRPSWRILVLTSLILGGALVALLWNRGQLPGAPRPLMSGWWYGQGLPCSSASYQPARTFIQFGVNQSFVQLAGDVRCHGRYRIDRTPVPPHLIVNSATTTRTYAFTLTHETLTLHPSSGEPLIYTWHAEPPCDVRCF